MESKNNFLQDLLNDESLQEAILDGLRALEDCAPFALEEIPELSSPLAFNAWLMGLEEEEEEQRVQSPSLEEMGEVSPSPSPPSSPSFMLYDPHEQRYYEVPAELAQLRDQPQEEEEEEEYYDADDKMEVSHDSPCRPRKRRTVGPNVKITVKMLASREIEMKNIQISKTRYLL